MTDSTTPPTIAMLPGAPWLAHTASGLCLEGLPLKNLAQEHGTPLFVYSKSAILAALAAYQKGLSGRDALICYAMKANSNLAILKLLSEAGCGFDIVSGGELDRALAVGADPRKIVFSGIGKTRAEIRHALQTGIACFNVESMAELDTINEVAGDLGQVAPISIRVNPDVDAHTHPYIATGLHDNKFGIAHDQALDAYRHAAGLAHLKIQGIDCHIGSQITEIGPWLDAMDRVLELIDRLANIGIAIEHLDFGGGLGINYQGETPPAADVLWSSLLEKIDQRGHGHLELIVEPGRSLVGNAGVCLTEVLYLKPGQNKNFCIVDAAMNDLPRPSLYQAHHAIVPLEPAPTDATPRRWDVVGPVCESGDWIGRDRALAVAAGDHLAVLSAGAYCMSMASNYNSRPRAAEVLIDNGQARLIRKRASTADLWQHERF